MSVSCASAGNCAAGGFYTDGTGHHQAFVASETQRHLGTGDRGARPGRPEQARRTPASARCRAPRRATARPSGATRTARATTRRSWPARRNGRWRQAIEVPGLAALNKGGDAPSARCRAPRRATARPAGPTSTARRTSRGSWPARRTDAGTRRSRYPAGRPEHRRERRRHARCRAPRPATAQPAGTTTIRTTVVRRSWPASGTASGARRSRCPAPAALNSRGRRGRLGVVRLGGQLRGRRVLHRQVIAAQAFVASEANGAWRKAIEVPGPAALNKGGDARVVSVSCASAGNCAAVGGYNGRLGPHARRSWPARRTAPGARRSRCPAGPLNRGGSAGVLSVSCASAGNCAAGGSYTDRSGHTQAFVASQT